ncbi:MAG TPA: hypothetical protein VK631_09870 [Solirubrobacteraceae bacterium]|nr:hypothetical protein [Solirubrobacteraceae bacterium]
MTRVDGYGEDLAAIHAAGFTDIARAAGEELLARLDGPARVVDLGCGDGTTAALLAAGEVLGYALDARNDDATLDAVLARAAAALRPAGLLLFDLAGPGRIPASGQHTWTEGDGWAVLAEARARPHAIERRVVTFRDLGGGHFRRSEETHRLLLHRPADVLARLRAAGFTARVLPDGYAGEPLPRGLTAYLARRR